MAFKVTKQDLKKSQLCPPGMHNFTLITVKESYLKPNGVTVQETEFETDAGYIVKVFFNSTVMTNLFEFVAAADKITFDLTTFEDMEIELKDYIGKKVSGSVSHETREGKTYAGIDNFYQEGKVPF